MITDEVKVLSVFQTCLLGSLATVKTCQWLKIVWVFNHLRWWLTMQCAASSLSKGTSNKAWWKRSSLAVGLLEGSTSRHFWMNSWKKHTHIKISFMDFYSMQRRRAFCVCRSVTYPLQRVLQGLNGTVYGFLGHIRRITVTLDFQHSHLREVIRQRGLLSGSDSVETANTADNSSPLFDFVT